ncbi:DNA polymerase theta isoform X2 [Palaemon carinicauda]|uniref:DNA polymerase theta isoform X2 n=1 Tax=Palaemon carinicauda TaxID=392227 RepID=UPI0035B68BF4
MDLPRGQGDGPRRKFLGRFAIPVQPRKITNKGFVSSTSKKLFMRPAYETKEDVQRSSKGQPSNEECSFGDSFCDNDVLMGIKEIEAQYPCKKQTGSDRSSKDASDSDVILSSNVFHREAREMPKNLVSNTVDNPVHIAAGGDTKWPKDVTKDQFEFASMGNDTLKAINAMDLDISIDEVVSPDDNKIAKPLSIVITPLRNRSKRRVSSASKVPNIRRSQRLQVKSVNSKADGDFASHAPVPEKGNKKLFVNMNKLEKRMRNNQESLDVASKEASFRTLKDHSSSLFDETPEDFSLLNENLKANDSIMTKEKDTKSLHNTVKTPPHIQNNCLSSKKLSFEVSNHENKCVNGKDNSLLPKKRTLFPEILENNSNVLKDKSKGKCLSPLNENSVDDSGKKINYIPSEQPADCRVNIEDKKLIRDGAVFKAAVCNKPSNKEETQVQDKSKEGNEGISAKMAKLKCSAGVNSENKELITNGAVFKAAVCNKPSNKEETQVQGKSKEGNNAISAKMAKPKCSAGVNSENKELFTDGAVFKAAVCNKPSNKEEIQVRGKSKEGNDAISEKTAKLKCSAGVNSEDKELNTDGAVFKAAVCNKPSNKEETQVQSKSKEGNDAISAKTAKLKCSAGANSTNNCYTPVTMGRMKKPAKLDLNNTVDLNKNIATKCEVQSEGFHKPLIAPDSDRDGNSHTNVEKHDFKQAHLSTKHTSPSDNTTEPVISHEPRDYIGKELGNTPVSVNSNESAKIQGRKSSLNKSANISKGEHSFLSTQARMELSSWGLPEPVLQRYIENGIKTMFPWQAECLSLPGVLDGRNLVYSAPTSAGKTLVSELLLLKRVLETGRKGLYILPFVSVAREKMYYLQKMFSPASVRVEGFMGSHGPPGGLKVTDIAICTIEKANNLVNRLLEEKRFEELGIIIVDEIHMLGDPHRGYLLELLLTKTMFVCQTAQSLKEDVNSGVQIVGMSATLPNLDLLALWLNSQLYSTDYRPVPLAERVKIGRTVFDCQLKKFRELDNALTVKNDSDHLIQLCLETVLEGFSVLVFCPTKVWCEKLAESVAKEFFSIGKPDSQYASHISAKLRESLNSTGISKVIEALRKCPVGLDKVLGRSISFAVAYHHAGLTFDERDIVEGGFRNGSIRVLVATSTLSSGVNLPARRVIIRSPVFGGSIIDTLTYKQMIGRAGRKGVDTEGESILVCREGEKQKALTLLSSSLPPVTSCLQQDSSLTSSMKRAVLEVIVSGVAAGSLEVESYCSCTLLAASLRNTSESQQDAQNSILSCVQFLEENEFIRLQETDSGLKYIGTQLGCAVLASGLSPDEGLLVFSELHRARQCFVLENELHIIYQVTPVYVSSAWPNMDWLTFLSIWEGLSDDMKRVAELVGVEESFIVRAMKGTINRKVRRQAKLLAVHQRFYTALALHELVQEVPLNVVAQKYSATRGMLQSLQQSAATFAGMVTVFCNRLGWHNLQLLVSQFHDRLHFGIQRELCDLVRLSSVNGQRARYLYDAGLETVKMVAHSTKEDVENILHLATPFQSNKMDEKDSRFGGTIWLSSNRPLTEAQAAALIIEEARQLVQKELGLASIDWTQRQKVITTPNRRPRPRKGSSSAKRRSSSAKKKHSPPNPILLAESKSSTHVISSTVLDRTVESADMTPSKRKRSSPQDVLSLNRKNRTVESADMTPLKRKRSSPHVLSLNRKYKSTRLDLEGEKVTEKRDIEAEEDEQLALELKEKDKYGKDKSPNVKSNKTEEETLDVDQRNCTTGSTLLPNDNADVQKTHAIGSLDAEEVEVEYVIKNHKNVLLEVNSDSKELELKSSKKERKDSNGKPKNRHWQDRQSEQTGRKDKENVGKLENNEVSGETELCTKGVDRSLSDQTVGTTNAVSKTTVSGILFGENKSKADSELAKVKPTSFYVSESQDDGINVFSRKRKTKVKESVQMKNNCINSNCDDVNNVLPNQEKVDLGVRTENENKKTTNPSTSTKQRNHSHKEILSQKRRRGSEHLSPEVFEENYNSQRTLKRAKLMINSSSTPITGTDEKFMRETSFKVHEEFSTMNCEADLSFKDTERCDINVVAKLDCDLKEKRDRGSDLFRDSSFEKSGEGPRMSGGIDFLSESQKEAFLMTMNSEDFDSESRRFEHSRDEKQCNESCFDIACSKRSYEALLNSEPRKTTGQLISSGMLKGSFSFSETINQKCIEEIENVQERLLPKYHACEEDLGWDLDLSPLEEANNEGKMNRRTSLRADGSDSEFSDQSSSSERNSTKTRRFPRDNIYAEGVIPFELEQSICDLEDVNKEKINANKDDSLSDSFFERAFDTYLNASSSNVFDVDDKSKSPSEGGKGNTEEGQNENKTKMVEEAKLQLSVEGEIENISRKNRLSDDLFSSSIPLSQSGVCLQTATDEISKPNIPNMKLPAVDHKKGISNNEPSTSAAFDHHAACLDNSTIMSNSFCIIDVVGDAQLFDCFIKEWKDQKRFSLSLACEKPAPQVKKSGIGWRIAGHGRTPRCNRSQEVMGLVVENSSLYIVGMAVCWGGQDAYYINFKTTQEEAISCSFPTPPICEKVPFEKRISVVKEVFADE